MMSHMTKILPSDVTRDIILPKIAIFGRMMSHMTKKLRFLELFRARVTRAYSDINFWARALRAPKKFSGGFAALGNFFFTKTRPASAARGRKTMKKFILRPRNVPFSKFYLFFE